MKEEFGMSAKETALKILDSSNVGTMATVYKVKPHSRYMTFFHDDFTLYTATSNETDKVEELEKNPYTHILIGYDGDGVGDTYLEILGKAIGWKRNDRRQNVRLITRTLSILTKRVFLTRTACKPSTRFPSRN